MATTIEVERSGAFEAIDYGDFEITLGTSDAKVAPTASVETTVREDIQANQPIRITIDGETRFEGFTQSAGVKRAGGRRELDLIHEGVKIMEDTATFTRTNNSGVSANAVLQDALDETIGSSYLLATTGDVTLDATEYSCEDRPVKRIFRDICDRTNRVWYFTPIGENLVVTSRGAGGFWKAINTSTDGAEVQSFDAENLDTVRNVVTVIGTGDVAVRGEDFDSNSIDEYGPQPGNSPYKVNYITTNAEAQSLATELLQPTPQPTGQILVGKNVGTVERSLVNNRIDIEDPAKNISETGLLISEQTIAQGRATLQVGAGARGSIANINRNTKSSGDVTEPGSVYDTDRINDFAITETKIQDDSISTPKLKAGAVTAAKILAGTITAAEIAAGTITTNELDALDVSTQSLDITDGNGGGVTFKLSGSSVVLEPTASGSGGIGSDSNRYGLSYFDNLASEFISVDVLSPDGAFVTNPVGFQLGTSAAVGDNYYLRPGEDYRNFVGTSSFAYQEMHAHNFVTASPDPIDGVDPACICDTDWYENPPEAVRKRARDIGDTDDEVPEGRDHTPVELGTMANWLLEALKASNERIDDLKDRIERLESQI